MTRIVLLVEEYSIKMLLDALLPRIHPGLEFLCVPHEGKQDLEKSIPRKLRAWREPGVRFIVVRDNDGMDCHVLKTRLKELCTSGGRDDVIVRIVCQELEAWYLGDFEAVGAAFENPSLVEFEKKSRFRDPDTVVQPSLELLKLVPEYQKVSGARRMAAHMIAERNRSHSFKVFLAAVQRLVAVP